MFPLPSRMSLDFARKNRFMNKRLKKIDMNDFLNRTKSNIGSDSNLSCLLIFSRKMIFVYGKHINRTFNEGIIVISNSCISIYLL